MNRYFALVGMLFALNAPAQQLIVRADDMGVTHATNLACMDVFTNGIARSVEVMVPTGWYMEAVSLLKEHPEYDAGIHLVLNCEWTNLKWRPLTSAKTLVDSNGYFFPTPWKGSPDFPSMNDHNPDFAEAETELRAQIEMAKKHIPWLSHLSTHMGFDDSHPELKKIVQKLSAEYHLPFIKEPAVLNFPRTENMNSLVPAEREKAFVEQLGRLEQGKTYQLVSHPCYDGPEMQRVFTPEYKNVGADRAAEHFILTSKKVQETLKKKRMVSVSLKDFYKRQLSGQHEN